MKQIKIITFVLISIFSCKAQTSIVALEDKGHNGIVNNTYYKDLDNELNKFIGNWKFESGNVLFAISFLKKVQSYNGNWYEDKLVGDYKYEDNNIGLINYLPRINDSNVNDSQHTINGNRIIYKNYFPKCVECDVNERRFVLLFKDLERNYLSSEIAIRYFIEDGVEKIKVWLYDSGSAVLPYEGAPEVIRVPYGEYVLTKVQ